MGPNAFRRLKCPEDGGPLGNSKEGASFLLQANFSTTVCFFLSPPASCCKANVLRSLHVDIRISPPVSPFCHLNKFNFLVKTQLVLHSSGFNILNSTTSERECTVTHAFFLSINLRWPLLVTYGRVSLQEEVCQSYVHTVWSLQRLISVPGANLAVDTKEQLYAVFNSP